MSQDHSHFMRRALNLALKGKGQVSPNPCVGCVIVKNGKVVGEGYHQKFGGPHAEVFALNQAGSKAKGATLYINLEPCSHWGKTPPCVPQLLKAGIKKVFVAMEDPNPKVSGRGIQILRKGGLQIHLGLEKRIAEELNQSFITWMTQKRPYIVLKMAMSLDGKIASASGDSKWISSPLSRRLVHELRAGSDAVLIGANTAIKDNPSLTAHGAGRNPIRVILDPHLRTPESLRIYKDKKAPTLVITSLNSSLKKARFLQRKGIQILRLGLKYGKFELRDVVRNISKVNVSQLFIEGGGETAWSFICHRLVDEILVFVAPIIIGGKDSKTPVEGAGFKRIKDALKIKLLSITPLGPDVLIRGRFI